MLALSALHVQSYMEILLHCTLQAASTNLRNELNSFDRDALRMRACLPACLPLKSLKLSEHFTVESFAKRFSPRMSWTPKIEPERAFWGFRRPRDIGPLCRQI